MVGDGVTSDELWEALEPVLPTNVGRRGRPWTGLGQEDMEAILSIDSTSVRAHQHAAGARHDSAATSSDGDTGGWSESHEFARGARGVA